LIDGGSLRPARIKEVIMTRSASLLSASLAVVVLAPAAVQAGPPLICHPVDIGGAPSLPWGSGPGWNTPQSGYDRTRLVTDTLALLSPSAPIRVRMETLRRATVYVMRDPDRARELLARLEERARDAGSGKGGALALFDAGYLIETYKQARIITGRDIVDPARDGEAMVREARQRRDKDPDIEYAVGLIASGKPSNRSSR
jgi:hypothetical protein